MHCKFISLGPGGRENVTIGALEAMQQADRVYCFGTHRVSYALHTIEQLDIPREKIKVIELPMNNDRHAALTVYANLAQEIMKSSEHIVVATEGDTGIYATTHYVMDMLKANGCEVSQSAGIPSFIAAGALAGLSLVSQHERLMVVPGEISDEELVSLLEQHTTVVIMKLSRMEKQMHQFISIHKAYHYYYVEKVGMPEARYIDDVLTLQEMEFPYFSLMIVAKAPKEPTLSELL